LRLRERGGGGGGERQRIRERGGTKKQREREREGERKSVGWKIPMTNSGGVLFNLEISDIWDSSDIQTGIEQGEELC
jgi:hypothetical protein